MSYHPWYSGNLVVLDDGEPGILVSTGDDGTLQVRTATGIIISSPLDDAEDESLPEGNAWA